MLESILEVDLNSYCFHFLQPRGLLFRPRRTARWVDFDRQQYAEFY